MYKGFGVCLIFTVLGPSSFTESSIVGYPSSVIVNTNYTFTVAIRDAYGNLIPKPNITFNFNPAISFIDLYFDGNSFLYYQSCLLNYIADGILITFTTQTISGYLELQILVDDGIFFDRTIVVQPGMLMLLFFIYFFLPY